VIETEFLCRIRITLEPARELGHGPLGRRRVIGITGGEFEGPRFSGRVLAGGADWQLLRADGVAYLDARYTLQTTDGALVYVRNRGYRHGPPEVMERLARGEAVDASLYYQRATPWFETAAPQYAWLNRTICLATGSRQADAVIQDFYLVR
jgi:hypothetical protein